MNIASLDPSDPTYPSALAEALAAPPALRIRGAVPRAAGVAVVGTRRASAEGMRFTHELAATLAASGVVVWSGGAIGIDQAAHEGALSVGGLTVLVAGGGLARPYPPGSGELHERVAERGAVIGVVDDECPPQSWVFYARNAVLAAATRATIVVECPLQSGTRNTTSHARRAGRPVLVFPHPPWSPFAPAVREESRLGARIILSVEDLLHELTLGELRPTVVPAAPKKTSRAAAAPKTRPRSSLADMDADDRLVFDALRDASKHPDQLGEELGWDTSKVQRCLLSLLLRGELVEGVSGTYLHSRPGNETLNQVAPFVAPRRCYLYRPPRPPPRVAYGTTARWPRLEHPHPASRRWWWSNRPRRRRP